MRAFRVALLGLFCLLTYAQSSLAAAGVMPASRYTGTAKQAYVAANADPALAKALFCYCGCDKQKRHKSLIDCFRSDHGAHCGICMDEMIRAARYKKQGMSNKAIAKKIDMEFKSRYPTPHSPSATLKRYNALHGVKM
jgi:hypothetical protein